MRADASTFGVFCFDGLAARRAKLENNNLNYNVDASVWEKAI